jgi:hypothetical protein
MYYSQLAEGSSESLSASRGRHRRITCNEYFTLSLLIFDLVLANKKVGNTYYHVTIFATSSCLC